MSDSCCGLLSWWRSYASSIYFRAVFGSARSLHAQQHICMSKELRKFASTIPLTIIYIFNVVYVGLFSWLWDCIQVTQVGLYTSATQPIVLFYVFY